MKITSERNLSTTCEHGLTDKEFDTCMFDDFLLYLKYLYKKVFLIVNESLSLVVFLMNLAIAILVFCFC